MTIFRRMTAARRRAVTSALLAGLAGILSISYVVVTALAAPAPPAPTIATHQANPTTASRQRSGPAAPVFVLHPSDPSRSRTAAFAFTDTSRPVTFFCQLDSDPVRPCMRPVPHRDRRPARPHHQHTRGHGLSTGRQRYADLEYGPHCFYVYATDEAGHIGATAQFCWRILPPGNPFHRHHRHHHHHRTRNFTVGGDLPTPLYPGTSESLDLTFTNPNSWPITISSGAISVDNITISSNRPGCGPSNFAVTQGLTSRVTIPAHQLTPLSLSALLVPAADWPVIKMLETNTNQDACQGATLTLTYSGIEATR